MGVSCSSPRGACSHSSVFVKRDALPLHKYADSLAVLTPENQAAIHPSVPDHAPLSAAGCYLQSLELQKIHR